MRGPSRLGKCCGLGGRLLDGDEDWRLRVLQQRRRLRWARQRQLLELLADAISR